MFVVVLGFKETAFTSSEILLLSSPIFKPGSCEALAAEVVKGLDGGCWRRQKGEEEEEEQR